MKFPQKPMIKQFINEEMNPDTIILIGKDWLVTDVGANGNDHEFYLYEESKGECKELWQTAIYFNADTQKFDWENDGVEESFNSFVEPYLLAYIHNKV